MKRLRSPDRLPAIDVHVRWMVRDDVRDVLRIEAASYPDGAFAFDEAELRRTLRRRNVIGQVAETKDRAPRVLGFMIYGLAERHFELLSLAVDPAARRRRVATQMLNRLAGKLSRCRRQRIVMTLRDVDLAGHLLLRSLGFVARGVERHGYGTDVDGYRFELAPFTEED